AYYFQHRFSEDLDFFIFKEPDKIFLRSFAEKLKVILGADSMRFERLYDRNQFFFKFGQEELKIEFTKYPFEQFEKPAVQDGIRIDSLRDIAANKLMAMLDRFDPKDFVDLFYILQKFKLEDLRLDVERKFGITVGNIFLGGEIAKARRIEALPKMLKSLTKKELKEFFANEARELGNNIVE
ncbi:MAG: nucleotidyl transferase AbiEii/AbiGii toxin family protein, partial [bacterium]|nr:nucleotidyl transferase AbiEii/AbiGii toxin family protein [bacterium]